MPSADTASRGARRAASALRFGAIGLTAALALTACGSTAPSGAPSASVAASASPGPSAAASASPAPSAPSAVPSPSAAQAQLLLEVRSEGGFINPAASIGALPTVVVDTDGRIYTPAGAPDGALPLIPVVAVHDTGAAGAAEILAAAKAAGLVDGSAAGGGVVADTGSTVFTLEVDGTEVITRVAGAGGPGGPIGGPGGPGVNPGASDGATGGSTASASAAPSAAAMALLAKLTDPTTPWGGSTAAATPYSPTAYRLWVAPIAAGGTGDTAAPWPLTADPNTFGALAAANLGVDGLRSGVVTGADAATLATSLVAVPAGSTLSFGGHAYQVWIRPVLPDELGS